MDTFREIADWVKVTLFQAFWILIFTVGGLGIAGRMTIHDFETSWQVHHWWMLLLLFWTGLKAIADGAIIMAAAWAICACIIGFVGHRFHQRDERRAWRRLETLRAQGQLPPGLAAEIEQHRHASHREMLAIVADAINHRILQVSPRVQDRIMAKTHKRDGFGFTPRRKYRRRQIGR